MFTSATPSPPTVSASPVSNSSPIRSSGLRGGLSFLRNYTHSLQAHSNNPPPSSRSSSNNSPVQVPTSREAHSPVPPKSSETTSFARITPPTTTTTSPEPAPSSPSASSSSSSTPSASASSSRPAPLVRNLTAPETTISTADTPPPMTRTRTALVAETAGPTPAAPMTSHDSTHASHNTKLPSIRFIPHNDPRAARPSLQFSTISRTLPDESAVIRVGRYSERDNIPDVPPNVPSAAAVGFKSKVVSRKHCELWCKDGSWFIKDVKSSSGTFLNHIRLSQPNVESKPFRLKDGDIIQLGIDFRGGEEMIFRCVKIRVECNRGWQQALNTFNKQTHQQLRNLGRAKKDSDNASMHTSECSICLMSIAPCQSLFVAPCSHVWHYKCIRPILNGSTWPNFLCPNCRAVADLEADVEDMGDFETWDADDASPNEGRSTPPGDSDAQDRQVTPKASTNALSDTTNNEDASVLSPGFRAIINGIANMSTSSSTDNPVTPQSRGIVPSSSSTAQPVSINIQSANGAGLSPLFHHHHSGGVLSPGIGPECPMTPRNDVGPFVLDGSAGRADGQSMRNESPTSTHSAPTLPPVNFD